MNIKNSQIPDIYRKEIEEQINIFNKKRTFEERNSIPDTKSIPIEDKSHWFRIKEIVCVYVDMKGSTQLSASLHESDTAGAYQLFTGTAVALFDQFESPYIDVKGDGVFALFNTNQCYRALASAVTFKTFSEIEFAPKIKALTQLDIGCHIGIDIKRVLVKKIGLKRYDDRSDRQNEVWAGKPVNMASKLASISNDKELVISDRFFNRVTDRHARLSCACSAKSGVGTELWEVIDLKSDGRFDFDCGYKLKSKWCEIHGAEFCDKLLSLD